MTVSRAAVIRSATQRQCLHLLLLGTFYSPA